MLPTWIKANLQCLSLYPRFSQFQGDTKLNTVIILDKK